MIPKEKIILFIPLILLVKYFLVHLRKSIQAQLYNQQHINLNNDMRTYNLKMAYLLEDNSNTEHQVQLNFELDIYLD